MQPIALPSQAIEKYMLNHVPACFDANFTRCEQHCDCSFTSSDKKMRLEATFPLGKEVVRINVFTTECAMCEVHMPSEEFFNTILCAVDDAAAWEKRVDQMMGIARKRSRLPESIPKGFNLHRFTLLLSMLKDVEAVLKDSVESAMLGMDKLAEGCCMTCFAAVALKRLCLYYVPEKDKERAAEFYHAGFLQNTLLFSVTEEGQIVRLTYMEVAERLYKLNFVLVREQKEVQNGGSPVAMHHWINEHNIDVRVKPISREVTIGYLGKNPLNTTVWDGDSLDRSVLIDRRNEIFKWAWDMFIVPRSAWCEKDLMEGSHLELDTSEHEEVWEKFGTWHCYIGGKIRDMRLPVEEQSLPPRSDSVDGFSIVCSTSPRARSATGTSTWSMHSGRTMTPVSPSISLSSTPQSVEETSKTYLCMYYMLHKSGNSRVKCNNTKNKCKMAHGYDDLCQRGKAFYKTQPCTNTHPCKNSVWCMFAHSKDDKRY